MDPRRTGFFYALAAYLAWGFLPIYFKALRGVAPLEVLAHRVIWSVLLLGVFAVANGRGGAIRDALRPGRRAVLGATTLLIAVNWLIYIWAVQAGRVVEASLGYFINPLVNVLLGVAFLGERLSARQKAALALAAAGVAALVVRAGTFPWISIALALSFGLYGLLRKQARVDAIGGLFAETLLLAPAALALLAWRGATGAGAFGQSAGTTALLVAAGAVTSLPLVWFAVGVGRLRLSTMGLVQYVAPTCQFLLGVALYHEPFTRAHALAFGLIWSSLALYSFDVVVRTRRAEGAGAVG